MIAERFPTEEKAAVEIYGRGVEMVARIADLSKTGACLHLDVEFSTKANLGKGDLVRMTVTLGALKKEHRINAEVVWSNGQKTGVQFLNSQELLDRMINRGI